MGESAESSTVDIAPLEQKIIQQIEYYFGDLNLPRDKFLQAELKKDEGWIPLETLLKFNRLKTLSTDMEFITNAIRKSNHGVIEVDEGGKKIRRTKPLPENSLEFWHEVKARTAYVKGFPVTATLDEAQDFFKKFYDVERVLMRMYKSGDERKFKGSIFVTFKSRDDAKNFVNLDSVKYGDTELTRLMQEDYFKSKAEDSKRRKEEKGHKNGEKSKERPEPEKFTKGRIIRLSGIPKEGVTLDNIKDLFTQHQRPEWVEYEKGNEEAFVRFERKPDSAEEVLKLASESSGGKLKLGDAEINAEVVTGDVEEQYWDRAHKAMNEARDRKSGRGRGRGGRGGGRGGRGGRGGDRRQTRSGQGASSEPQNKKIRFSSSSESEAEEKAEKEHRNAKRFAPDGGFDGASANAKADADSTSVKKGKADETDEPQAKKVKAEDNAQ